MPLIVTKNDDVEEVIEVSDSTFAQIDDMMTSAVDENKSWKDVEGAVNELLSTGRVSHSCAFIDFRAEKPNWEQ